MNERIKSWIAEMREERRFLTGLVINQAEIELSESDHLAVIGLWFRSEHEELANQALLHQEIMSTVGRRVFGCDCKIIVSHESHVLSHEWETLH